jgi:hypothetical protein
MHVLLTSAPPAPAESSQTRPLPGAGSPCFYEHGRQPGASQCARARPQRLREARLGVQRAPWDVEGARLRGDAMRRVPQLQRLLRLRAEVPRRRLVNQEPLPPRCVSEQRLWPRAASSLGLPLHTCTLTRSRTVRARYCCRQFTSPPYVPRVSVRGKAQRSPAIPAGGLLSSCGSSPPRLLHTASTPRCDTRRVRADGASQQNFVCFLSKDDTDALRHSWWLAVSIDKCGYFSVAP